MDRPRVKIFLTIAAAAVFGQIPLVLQGGVGYSPNGSMLQENISTAKITADGDPLPLSTSPSWRPTSSRCFLNERATSARRAICQPSRGARKREIGRPPSPRA